MKTHNTTRTLLDAEDLLATLEFRERAFAQRRDERRETPPARTPHDFLALTLHPDLTPSLAPLAIANAQS